MDLRSTKSSLGLCKLRNWQKGLEKTCKHNSVVRQNSTLNVTSLRWGAALTQIPSILHKYIRLCLTQSDLCWLQGLPPLKQWPDHFHNQITNPGDYENFQKGWTAKYRKIFCFFHSCTSFSDKSVLSSPVSRLLGRTLIRGTVKITVLFSICKIRQNKSQIQLVRHYFKEKHAALQNIH